MYSQQVDGGSCSKCRSPATNITTCPLNPNAKKPNPNKHPLAFSKTYTVKSAKFHGQPPKFKAKSKPKQIEPLSEATLRSFLDKPVSSIEKIGKDSWKGIYVYTTKSGEKYGVKLEETYIRQLRANKIAELLGINVPIMFSVPKEEIPLFEELTLSEEAGGHEVLEKIPEYLVMEYIPNAVLLTETTIPKNYCDQVYIQIGKMLVFDILVWNSDRFYFLDMISCSDDVNEGNLLWSKSRKKLYSIDHDVTNRNEHYYKLPLSGLFNKLFQGQLTDEMIHSVTCVLEAFGRDLDCPDRDKILRAIVDTVIEVKEKYDQIKEIWPEVPPLPDAKIVNP